VVMFPRVKGVVESVEGRLGSSVVNPGRGVGAKQPVGAGWQP
jgi:hypothetical protein